jgi:hypothetical protein
MSTLKSNWAFGDYFTPADANAIAKQVNANTVAASTYTHLQTTPAATWTIPNPFGPGVHPASVLVVVGGEVVEADVDLSNLTNVVITFATPQAGRALIS